MKRTVLIIIALTVAVTTSGVAQPYLGGRVPLGYVTADVDTLDEDRFATGIEALAGLKLGSFGVEGRIGYMAHVYSTEILGETVSASMNYARLAVLGKYYPLNVFYLGAGLELSYLMGYSIATESESYSTRIEEQEGPIFLALDAGIELPIGPNLYLPIGAFFNFAIGNIPDDANLLELGAKAGLQYRY